MYLLRKWITKNFHVMQKKGGAIQPPILRPSERGALDFLTREKKLKTAVLWSEDRGLHAVGPWSYRCSLTSERRIPCMEHSYTLHCIAKLTALNSRF